MNKFNFENLTVKSTRKEEIYDSICKAYREKHQIKITNHDKKISKYFTYTTEVISYIDRSNLLKNALYCIFTDYNNYIDNVEDFAHEFGYDDYKEAKKIFNKLTKNNERFSLLIDEELYNKLEKYFENY